MKTDDGEKVKDNKLCLNHNHSPQSNLPYIHSSIWGPVCLLPARASRDGLPVQPEQSVASKPPGALSGGSSWDSQTLRPLDTLRSLGGEDKNDFLFCFCSTQGIFGPEELFHSSKNLTPFSGTFSSVDTLPAQEEP